jgi:hypothetical protein
MTEEVKRATTVKLPPVKPAAKAATGDLEPKDKPEAKLAGDRADVADAAKQTGNLDQALAGARRAWVNR